MFDNRIVISSLECQLSQFAPGYRTLTSSSATKNRFAHIKISEWISQIRYHDDAKAAYQPLDA